MRLWGLIGLAVSLGVACGGTVQDPGPDPISGWGASGGAGGTGGVVETGGGGTGLVLPPDAGVDAPVTPIPDAGLDVVSEYVEPECPDAGEPLPLDECDLDDPLNSCPYGQACYPAVEYPDAGDPCAQERFGAVCASEGYGLQGDSCADYMNDCSGGYMCVNIGGDDTQCLQVCTTFGENDCPPGLFCVPVDVGPGTGGCY